MKTITYNEQTHVLVPIEPNEEMIQRGCLSQSETAHPTYESWLDSHSSGIAERIRLYLKKDYQDMIAAAPQPEQVDIETVAWMNTNGAFNHMKKAEQDSLQAEAMGKLTEMVRAAQKPQLDRTAELEAALKVARDGIDEFLVANDPTEFGCACDLSVGYLCGPCHADMQQEPLKIALAKINEVLK